MHIKIFLKKLAMISVAAIMAVTLVGCYDLGDFSDESAYYAAFGEVMLVYQNSDAEENDAEENDDEENGAEEKDIETTPYSVRDYFYNKNTGENFTYGDPEDSQPDEGKDIPQLPYVYMVLPLNKALKIEAVGLYFNATKACSLEIYFYLVEELPDNGNFSDIQLLGEPESQPKLDGDTPMKDEAGNLIYEKIEYSDPGEEKLVATTTLTLKGGTKWDSILVEEWGNNKTVLETNDSQYLLLRFVNNSGLNKGDKPAVSFRVTNLLVRAVS